MLGLFGRRKEKPLTLVVVHRESEFKFITVSNVRYLYMCWLEIIIFLKMTAFGEKGKLNCTLSNSDIISIIL